MFRFYQGLAVPDKNCSDTAYKVGWNDNYWQDRAYEISGCDKNFVYLLEAENGMWDFKRRSEYYKDGIREPSYGFCQIHAYYHPEIVNDERFFTDQEWQLKKCYELYKDGVEFYGRSKIWKARQNIYFK